MPAGADAGPLLLPNLRPRRLEVKVAGNWPRHWNISVFSWVEHVEHFMPFSHDFPSAMFVYQRFFIFDAMAWDAFFLTLGANAFRSLLSCGESTSPWPKSRIRWGWWAIVEPNLCRDSILKPRFWGDVDTQGSVITWYHRPLSYGAFLGGESSGDPKSSAVTACRRRQGGGTSVETGRHCGKGQRIDLQSLQVQKLWHFEHGIIYCRNFLK